MNSLTRMKTVLEQRLPDRVPLMELYIDPSVADRILPGASSNDLVEYLDMDAVTVLSMIYEDHEVEWVDKGSGLFRDKWGALQRRTHDAIPYPVQPARLETPEDLRSYQPPDPADSPVLEKLRALKRRYPNGEKAVCLVGESGWAPAVFLRAGMENLLLDFALRPQFVKDLMTIGVEYYCELYRLAVPAGADIVLLGDDYSGKTGPFMSPAQFEELILPGDAKAVAAVKAAGAYCIKHTDGDIRKIMDQLVATGLDCLGPLEPVPGMELDGVLNRYPGKITVMGNVSVDLLSRGTEEQVRQATRKLLATASAHGPHIMSSGNTIASSVRPENFLAMVRTTQELGTYPIDPESF
jgi:uroporphyrinogen decarboxylase